LAIAWGVLGCIFYYLMRVKRGGGLAYQSQAAEIIRGPAWLCFDDALEGAEAEGV
jgi:hypothetical protein